MGFDYRLGVCRSHSSCLTIVWALRMEMGSAIPAHISARQVTTRPSLPYLRTAMGIPDRILDFIEFRPNDYAWSMDELVHCLCFRRYTEVCPTPACALASLTLFCCICTAPGQRAIAGAQSRTEHTALREAHLVPTNKAATLMAMCLPLIARAQKTIAYLESHDQSLMGDQTVLFRLLKEETYTGMSIQQVRGSRAHE